MELSPDIACFKRLTWRCDLPAGSDCEVLAQRLLCAGFKPAQSLPGSILLKSAERHEIVLVPRTGRAQIRVHYMTEEAERRFVAERIFVAIVNGVLGRIKALPQPA